MAYQMFSELCPSLAETETRMIIITPAGAAESSLPAGDYGLLEMYCPDPKCDCRRVMFAVWSSVSRQIEAYVGFGWEKPEFYHKWCPGLSQSDVDELVGPSLNDLSVQGPWAPALLRYVVKTAIDNPEYVERLKRHYTAARKSGSKNTPRSRR